MWKMWNRLFGWQYLKIRSDGAIFIVRMKPFGDGTWDGKFDYINRVNHDPRSNSATYRYQYCIEKAIPLTDKLFDQRPKQKAEIVQLRRVK